MNTPAPVTPATPKRLHPLLDAGAALLPLAAPKAYAPPVYPPALAGLLYGDEGMEGPGGHFAKGLKVGPDLILRVRKGKRVIVAPTGHAGTLLVKVVTDAEWDAANSRGGVSGFGFVNEIVKGLADIVGHITKAVKDGRDAKMQREKGAAGMGCAQCMAEGLGCAQCGGKCGGRRA